MYHCPLTILLPSSMPPMRTFVALVLLSIALTSIIFFAINFCKFTSICGSEAEEAVLVYKCKNESVPSTNSSDNRILSLPWRQSTTPEAALINQAKLMRSYINHAVDPCDNFYEFACGNWEKINPIPADSWEHSTITQLQSDLQLELRELLSQPVSSESRPSAIDKAKIAYKNCMDLETISKRGIEPLLKSIEDLGGWPVLGGNWSELAFDWVDLATKISMIGNGVLISYETKKSPLSNNGYIIYLKQTSLGMTNRDNYLKKENAKNLNAYRVLIVKVLQLFGVSPVEARNTAKEIINFEVSLANATLPQEATKTEPYLGASIEIISKAYGYVDWGKFFSDVQGTELPANQSVLIHLGAKYYVNLYYVLRNTSRRTVANYMMWRYVEFFVSHMDGCFREAWNDFHAEVTGQTVPMPAWRTCVNVVNSYMGMATTAMFVRKHFDEASRNETARFVATLKEAFHENLQELDWIDDKTKAYANNKTTGMSLTVGYPDLVLSDDSLNELYQAINISDGKHFENIFNMIKTNRRRGLNRLFMPFDRNEWPIQSLLVNALYDMGTNRILVLAGLLQPPIFHKHFPQSLNYGGVGMFLAHEIIHGFDDTGRKFDVDGNPFEWWSKEAISGFDKRKDCFIDEYEKLATQDQSFKSIATLSENLADNGGIRLSYKAYKKWKMENPHQEPKEIMANLELSDDQLFFLSFAQLFCAAIRPEAEVESRSYKKHSPAKYRVLGTLMNFDKFAEVYSCPPRSTMNPSTKCRLW